MGTTTYLGIMHASVFLQKSAESSSQLSQEQKSVFNEDLQKKIEENERLHILVSKILVFL